MHRLITELPFAITVVTVYKSASKMIGAYEFRAVALKEKAIGFENLGTLLFPPKLRRYSTASIWKDTQSKGISLLKLIGWRGSVQRNLKNLIHAKFYNKGTP